MGSDRLHAQSMSDHASKFVGIWIDHARAVVVGIDGGTETVAIIQSNVEGHFRLKGGSRSATPHGPQNVVSESQRENRRNHQLKRYYGSVIAAVGNARAIFIFGPGEAKTELKRELMRSKGLATKLVGTETTDKMTENQVRAKVRELFAKPSPQTSSRASSAQG